MQINNIRASLSKLNFLEFSDQVESQLSQVARPILEKELTLTIFKQNALLLFMVDKIELLSELSKERDFRTAYMLGASPEMDFSVEEYMLVNCVDFAYGPCVSMAIIMFLLNDIDEIETLEILESAYFYDNVYRTEGLKIDCFDQSVMLRPQSLEPETRITSMWFQDFFHDFDAATPNKTFLDKKLDEAGVEYWSFIKQNIETRDDFYRRSLVLCKAGFMDSIRSHLLKFDRHTVHTSTNTVEFVERKKPNLYLV